MELAFDREGNPFRFRTQTRKLRPRRWKHAGQRGTCAAVLDPDGEPLFLDADADFATFRTAVRNVPGFYRLDQCDSDCVPIEDAPPAYVTLESARNAPTLGDLDPRDAIIRDLAQTNADISRTLIERFSDVMHASAVVLRAADGAGLPRREPPPPPPPPTPDDNDDDDNDDEDHDDADEHRPEPAEKLWALIEQMLPTIQMWLAAMASKRSSTTPAAAPPPTLEHEAPLAPAASSSAPLVDGVAAGQSAPASPVAGPNSSVSSTSATLMGSIAAPVAVPLATPVATPSANSMPSIAAPSDISPPAVGAPIAPPRNAPPTTEPTPEQWVHLFAIRARLSPHERTVAETVLTRMTSELRAQWLAELSALTVEQAADAVRSMVPKPPMRSIAKRPDKPGVR